MMRNKLMQIAILALLFLTYNFTGSGIREYTPCKPSYPRLPPFLGADDAWVDSVMGGLSLEERIAQMIMVQAYSNRGEEHIKAVGRLVSRYRVGGIIFFQGDPVSQARMTNLFQEKSRVPLLVAIDGETGLGFRLDNTIEYPPQMVLGAVADDNLIYQLGRDMARQLKRLGVHMNFAPVADINNNPANPVINTRSFGDDRANVASKVVALMRGMQEEGVLVTAKHFPGHGDTDTDSHYALPVVPYDRERLDSLELYPFREAILRGLTCVMVAHLQVPALDDRKNRPASVSEKVITGLLKKELDFRGLVITDAMNMKGLSDYFEPGQAAVEAVRAGNDILLMPEDVGTAISELKKAVRRGEIAEESINRSCRKILQAKYWAGLNSYKPVKIDSLLDDINHPSYGPLHRELIRNSITLVRNRDSLLPLKNLEKVKLATVTISETGKLQPGAISDLYLPGTHFTMAASAGQMERAALLSELEKYHTVIVHVLNTSSFASKNYGISDETVQFIEMIDPRGNLILNLAGIPYILSRFSSLDNVDALIISYSDKPPYQEFVIQGIFGGISFNGRLPVSGESFASTGEGLYSGVPVRLGYADPWDVGLDPDTLARIETIIREAIGEKAFPGCQVLVARHGKVVWHKAYGYHTYQRRRAVQLTDLYDLASLTKIVATVPALMRLRDQGKFHEDSLLGSYPVIPDSSNKAGLRVGDILSHQAGLVPWIPFYYSTLEPLDTSQHLVSSNWSHTYPLKIGPSSYANRNVKYVDSVYAKSYAPDYPIQVAEDLYLRADYRDSICRAIYDSELLEPEYRYSDLGFYMFQQVIESTADTMLYPYVWYNFYAPLGATTLGYLPLNRFPEERIVPTENDIFFRRQLLHGYVHDPGAAMLGGIAGHAGLFGNANDMAKMMQMYLNGGWYGERKYLDSATLATYTSCWDCENGNRRGLGFDRPVTDEPGEGPACADASPMSYGHSGFTGTLAWVDPACDMIFIFLSNRIHPNQGNTLLIDENIRTRIQQVVYDAIMD
jgi:beta-N-acetylhexosaminidase